MNFARWMLVVAIASAAAGSGTAAALQLRDRASAEQKVDPTRSLAATCMRSAAVAFVRR
jgi:hypothetical protein